MSESPSMIVLVECWAGPADGQQYPIDTSDPLPELPVKFSDQLYWYTLHQQGDAYLYVLRNAKPKDGWTPRSN